MSQLVERKIVRENGISCTYNLINFINGMIGPGCFSVAMAFKQGGLWTAFFLVFFIGTISTIAMHKVVMCSQYLCKITDYEYLDYGDMAGVGLKNSFSFLSKYHRLAKYFVNGCLIAFQIGVASVSYVFVIEHIQQIFSYFNVATHLSTTDLFLIYTIPATLINFVKNIRTVTFICLVGNVFIFLSIAMILQELFTSTWQWQSLPSFTSFDGLVNCAGSLLYSFEGQAMVLPLENKLKYPQDMIGFTGVLATGMNLVSVVYTYCGFFGYITYGQAVQGSLTLNLPDTVENVIIKILLVFVVFFGNVLQIYVIVEMLWPPMKTGLKERKCSNWLIITSEYLFRFTTVMVPMTLSMLVPKLQDIIPFIGITAGMMLSWIIPSVMSTLVFLPKFIKEEKHMFYKIGFVSQNVFFFVIGWFFLISGLQANISAIINKNI